MLKLHIQIHAGTHTHARAHSPQSCATFAVARRAARVASAFLPTFCFPLAQIMIPRHIASRTPATAAIPVPLYAFRLPLFSPAVVGIVVVAAYLLQRLFAMARCHCLAAGEVSARVAGTGMGRRGAADRVSIVWSLCLQQITLLAQHFNVRD